MLLPEKRWVLKETNNEIANRISKELNISYLVAVLLVNRGIHTRELAERFLYTEKNDFHDPFLLVDMDKTVQRIKLAIDRQEKILIFGDYDADGVTSTAVLMGTLLELGANVSYYIPNRFTEGYGPNELSFRQAHNEGISLIITVDTGIAALHEAKIASELGMDLIITDHHEPGPELPNAYSIIHPKHPDSKYPFSDLAGVGVALKLAHALYGELPDQWLDLVAIGTIADLVPLYDENRLIVKRGLKNLTTTTRPGLLELFKISSVNLSAINEETVGFTIAPRLNAAGRLDHAGSAVDLLMTEDKNEAAFLAEEIDFLNKERQQIVTDITNEAITMVENERMEELPHVIVIGKEGWNPGVIGIVASRLVEKYYRPTIVLSFDHETGLAKGSARSIEGFDLFQNLSECRELLPHFGGHTMAAGMTLAIEDVNLLRIKLNEAAKQQLTSNDFIPVTELDTAINIEEIDIETIQQLDMLAPYGVNNPKPQVLIKEVTPTNVRKIGASKTHLKLSLEREGHILDGVGFNLGHRVDEIAPGSQAAVIGELSINEWNNRVKPQIFIKDIAIKEWQLFDLRGNKNFQELSNSLSTRPVLYIAFSPNSFIDTQLTITHIFTIAEAENLFIDGKDLVLLDLPPNLEWLELLVKDKSPARIYACFYNNEDHFFSTLPTREHFKWYYAFLLKRQTFNLKKFGAELAKRKGWSESTVEFMSQVFFELDFVKIEEGIISMNQVKMKKDLGDSPTYQQRLQLMKLEQVLLYSTYAQLKQWFQDRLAPSVPNEEEIEAWT